MKSARRHGGRAPRPRRGERRSGTASTGWRPRLRWGMRGMSVARPGCEGSGHRAV